MATTKDDRHYEQQAEIFERLYQRTENLLERFGKPDSFDGPGDYSIYGDYWGRPQVKVSVGNLELLRSHVINLLQALLTEFPGWEFVVAVVDLDHLNDWPNMGLMVRAHEIIDGLQRQYFPLEFQNIRYEGSRPGTDRD